MGCAFERNERRCRLALVAAEAVLVVAFTLLVGGLAACGSKKAAAPPKASPVQLKVMEFNIENGGTGISFAKVVEAVKAADPDVVGLEEAETNSGRLAHALGWQYFSNGMQIVSRYPIIEPSADGAYALIEVKPGYVVALSNVHLPSAPYGPYFMNKGGTLEKVVALEERVRLPAIEKQLPMFSRLAEAGTPTFLVGDFNSPSMLDYIASTVGTRPQITYPIAWPVSKAVLDAGLRDSWRDVYPDPVANPGLTWWAARPRIAGEWNPSVKNPQDRIDFIYAGGPSRTLASEIIGEKGGPEVSEAVSPWPSDHRAVMSTFEVTPAPMPVLVAVDSWLVTQGDPLRVTFHGAGDGSEKLVLVPAGGDAATTAVASQPATEDATGTGVLTVDTSALQPGTYEAILLGADGGVLAKVPFWLRAKDARVELTTDKPTYASGDPIVVTWADAPANRWDWIGVYKASAADPNVDWYLVWQYTGGAQSGTVHGMPAGTLTLQKDTIEGSPWPLPPGKYVAYYLLADAYESVAKAEFTVTK